MDMKKENDFNGIAPVYDILSFLVFGRSIKKSQLCFLDQIPPTSKLLIVGGGSGAFLLPLLERRPNVSITYVELSEAMIRRCKERIESISNPHVEFVHADVHHYLSTFKNEEETKFDVVITHFFLDVMNSAGLQSFTNNILNFITKDCMWLCSDFVLNRDANYLKRAFVKSMYLFFRVFSNLEGNRLLPFKVFFKKAGFKQVDRISFYFGMIDSCLYRRVAN